MAASLTPNSPDSNSSRARENRFFFPAALAVLWVVMAALAGPVAEFPLNDSWSYAQIPRVLIEEGRLYYPPWVSMALLTQVLWGTLFCLPFGFSYTALRLSTLTLGLAGVLGVYVFLRECRAGRPLAFFGALTVAANPVFFNLSLTFMSDVPFFSLAILSVWCFTRGARRNSFPAIAAGVFFACAATLVRDVGLAIPAAFAAVSLFRKDRRVRVAALIAIAAPLACHLAFQHWLETRQGLPALYTLPRELLLQSFRDAKVPLRIAKWSVIQLVYLGFFLFPFLSARAPRFWNAPGWRRRVAAFAAWAALLVLAVGFGCRRLMPLATKPGNIFRDFGLGPAVLSDVYSLGLPHVPTSPWWFRFGLTAAGVAGGAILVSAVLRAFGAVIAAWKNARRSRSFGTDDAGGRGNGPGSLSAEDLWPALFVLAAAAFCFIPFSLGEVFDRYYLLELPLMMGIVLVAAPRSKIATPAQPEETFLPPDSPRFVRRLAAFLAVAALLLSGVFAVAGTREYLSWNRARWQALNDLTSPEGISPRDIDGGFEFNGLHTYDPKIHPTDPRFWMRDSAWMVTFGPVEGYREWKRYPYRRWLPWKKGYILVLRRGEGTPGGQTEKTATPRRVATLLILHTNDMHAHLLPARDGRGGMANVAAYLKKIRRERPDVLVLDAGDMTQGTPVSTIFQGVPIFEVMNAMGFDAATLGNHEFDNGHSYIFVFREKAEFPILCSNVFLDGENIADAPSRLVNVDGVNVGVIGVATGEYVHDAALAIAPPEKTVREHLAKLEPEAALIVVLSHLGYLADQELALAVPEIDVIVGGHTHKGLPEPVRVGSTLILQTAGSTEQVGRLELAVDLETEEVLSYKGSLVPIPEGSLPPDPESHAVVRRWETRVVEIVDVKIGHNPGYLGKEALCERIEQVWRAAYGTDFALHNLGGVRAPLEPGDITVRDIYTILPFDNTLAILELSADQVRRLVPKAAFREEKPLYTVILNSFLAEQFIQEMRIPPERVRWVNVNFREPILDYIRKHGNLETPAEKTVPAEPDALDEAA